MQPSILWYLFDFRHVCIERQSVTWQHQLQPSIFFYGTIIISRQHLSWTKYISKAMCFFTTLTVAIHYRSIVDSKKFEGYFFIWGNQLQPCFFKGAFLFHRTTYSNVYWKSVLFNARKHLQSSHSFMVNVFIWQFHNSNCSCPLWTVIF